MTTSRLIELTEYQPAFFPAGAIPEAVGQRLWHMYGRQIEVQEPSFRTGGQWRLTAQGWVGHIPLSRELQVVLRPKIPLRNLFGMWEYAYQLNQLKLPEGWVNCQSLPEFYERLAHQLALRVLERGRKGFYRAYLAETETLPYLRGRLEARPGLPGQVKLACHFEEHTADVADNGILAFTLERIARSGLCSERVIPAVRLAHRSLHALVTPAAYQPQECVGRVYGRLNEDYRPMHLLCRFFLAHSGPAHPPGERPMLPFLVEMAQLYEKFVAEWLQAHLPSHLELKIQERVNLSPTSPLHFQIDLSLREKATGATLYVLDTKYKAGPPTAEDLAQVMAYAKIKGSPEAILIYPAPLPQPLDLRLDGLRLRALTFNLSGDLEQAGQQFLRELLAG